MTAYLSKADGRLIPSRTSASDPQRPVAPRPTFSSQVMWIILKAAFRSAVLASISVGALASVEAPAQNVISFLPDDVLPTSVLNAFLDAKHVGRYRVVEVNVNALRQMLRDASTSSEAADPPKISLPLIDQSVVSIELSGGGESHDGWQAGFASFYGKVSGDELSTAVCVIAPDGSMNLVIHTGGKRYKLEKTQLLPYHIYWVLGEGFNRKID